MKKFEMRHLKVFTERADRIEYICGCYRRRSRSVWSFFPVCKGHKRQVRAEWNARPWYGKLAAYALLCWLFILFGAGVWMFSRFIYLLLVGK